MTLRTPAEIANRMMASRDSYDPLGFGFNDLLCYLPYDAAKPVLNADVTQETWDSMRYDYTEERVKKEMVDYMPFAWDKANNCRGISAGRSMVHYYTWCWLLGDEVFEQFKDLMEYEYYGKDKLVRLCEFLGLDSKQWDDGRRVNSEL